MSKIKTKNHPFFYEGLYWNSRNVYAAWVKDQRIIASTLAKISFP